MIEIARACRDKFEILFISYGGMFESLIINEGFKVELIQPRLSEKKIHHLINISKGERFGRAFSTAEIKERLESEAEIYKSYHPVAVLTGFCVSIPVSARISKIPVIWVSQTTWLREFYDAGWIVNDKIKSITVSRIIGHIVSYILIIHSNLIFLNQINRILKKKGISTYKNVFDFWRGDYNLLAEPEGFSPVKNIPATYQFTGPLPGKQFSEIPDVIKNIPRDKPIVYFAMGSVGRPSIIVRIIKAFKNKPYRVIAPVKAHIEKYKIAVPENVLVTDWLPAHVINPMADITFIHGGIGSVMNAVLAGKPVVGLGMQFEQDGNLSCLVRRGFAIRFSKFTFSPNNVIKAIDQLLADKDALVRAQLYKREVEVWNGPERSVQFLEKVFG